MGCGGVGNDCGWSGVGRCVRCLGCFNVDEAGGEVGQEEVGGCVSGGVVGSCVGYSLRSYCCFCDVIECVCMLIECVGNKVNNFGDIVGGCRTCNSEDVSFLVS